jgi:hypothetical protein
MISTAVLAVVWPDDSGCLRYDDDPQPGRDAVEPDSVGGGVGLSSWTEIRAQQSVSRHETDATLSLSSNPEGDCASDAPRLMGLPRQRRKAWQAGKPGQRLSSLFEPLRVSRVHDEGKPGKDFFQNVC